MKTISLHIIWMCLVLTSHFSVSQSQGNKAIVKNYFQALSKIDTLKLSTLVHDQFVFNDFTTGLNIKSKVKGLEYFKKVKQSGSTGIFKLKTVTRINDFVWSVDGIWYGTYGGKAIKARFNSVLILSEDGLVKRQTDHFDVKAFK